MTDTLLITLRPGGDSVRVILMTDAHVAGMWRGKLRAFPHVAGDTLCLGRAQAQRLVDAGLARWPGKAPSPAVCA